MTPPIEVRAVGEHYDTLVEYYALLFGEQLHFGWWPDPEDAHRSPPFPDFPAARLRLADLVLDRLDVPAGGRVLDVGCGTGGPALHLARRTGCEVLGVTVSPVQARRAADRAAAEGLADRVRFAAVDVLDLAAEPGSFDAVLALESMMHMPSRAAVLARIAGLLRPGGRVALTDITRTADPAGAELVTAYGEAAMVDVLPSPDDYRELTAAAGLELTELTDLTAGSRPGTFANLVRTGRERRDELTALIGADTVEAFFAMCGGLADAGNLGYLLAAGER